MRSKSIRLPLAAAALSLAMLTSCGAPEGRLQRLFGIQLREQGHSPPLRPFRWSP